MCVNARFAKKGRKKMEQAASLYLPRYTYQFGWNSSNLDTVRIYRFFDQSRFRSKYWIAQYWKHKHMDRYLNSYYVGANWGICRASTYAILSWCIYKKLYIWELSTCIITVTNVPTSVRTYLYEGKFEFCVKNSNLKNSSNNIHPLNLFL